MYFKYTAAALAAVLPLCSAQTWSKCNPLAETCPPNKGLAASTCTADFTSASALDQWEVTAGKVPVGPQGAEFTVAKQGDAPTIDTDFYFFFGKAEVVMKAAPGTGVVSSIVLESDDLDEVDLVRLGGDTTQVQTNYFGKGDTTTYDRGTYVPVATPQETFHTYTIDWTKDAVTWSIDGAVVRTLTYNDAKGGTRFPQTPMRLRLAAGPAATPATPGHHRVGRWLDRLQRGTVHHVRQVRPYRERQPRRVLHLLGQLWLLAEHQVRRLRRYSSSSSVTSSTTSTASSASSTSSKTPSTSTLATSTKATPTPSGTSSGSNSSSSAEPTTTGGSGSSNTGSWLRLRLWLWLYSSTGSSTSAGASATPELSQGAAGSIKGSVTPALWCSAPSLPCWHSKQNDDFGLMHDTHHEGDVRTIHFGIGVSPSFGV
nr:allergen [Aspergillus fumigatus]